MKKVGIILCVIGVITAGVVIKILNVKGHEEKVGHTAGLSVPEENELQAARIPSEDESRRDSGDTSLPAAVSSAVEKQDPSVPLERPVASRETIPKKLHYLFGWGEEPGGYQRRSKRVQQLERDLPDAEVHALLAFLYMKPREVGLSDGDFNATGDVVMEKMEDQLVIHPDYTDHLTAIYYATSSLEPQNIEQGMSNREVSRAKGTNAGNEWSYSETWRNYCLQHIGSTYKRMAPEKLPPIRKLYVEALAPGNVMAGTALLAMKNSLGGAGMTEELLGRSAMQVVSDGSFPDSNRLTALLVASELGSPDALALAREVVESKEVSAHFKAAAIASVGMQGDSGDLDLLQKYTKSSDIRYRMAATSALEKLNDRISN